MIDSELTSEGSRGHVAAKQLENHNRRELADIGAALPMRLDSSFRLVRFIDKNTIHFLETWTI